MKKITLCLLSILLSIALPAQSTDEQVEQSILNGIAHIREGLRSYLPQNKPYDFQPYTDTLYRYLCVDSVPVKISVEVFAQLTLQCYFAETNDERIDYSIIHKMLYITKDIDEFHDLFFLGCANALGEHYEERERWEHAVQAYKLAMKALSKIFGDTPNYYEWKLSNDICNIYYNRLNDYKKALEYQIKSLKIIEHLLGPSSDDYFSELLHLGIGYHICGMPQQADSCFALYQPYLENNLNITDEQRQKFFYDRGATLQDLKNNQQAISFFEKAYQYASNDSTKIVYLLHIGNIQQSEGDDSSLANTLELALQIIEQEEIPKTEQFLELFALSNLTYTKSYKERILDLFKRSDKKDNLAYKAYFSWADQKYESAYKLINQAMADVDNKLSTDSSFLKGREVNDLVTVLFKMGIWEKAIHYESMILNHLIKTHGRSHPLCISTMSLLASMYQFDGDYQTADIYLQNALEAAPDDYPNYSDLLKTKADWQFNKGNLLEAAVIYEKLLDYNPNTKELWDIYYGRVISFLCEFDIRKNNRDNRLPLGIIDSLLCNAISILEDFTLEYFPPDSQEAFLTTSQQASYYALKGDYETMNFYASEAERIAQDCISNPEMKSDYLDYLAGLYMMSHNYQKALSLIENTPPEYSLRPDVAYLLRAEIWLGLEKKKKAQKNYIQLTNEVKTKVCHDFAYLTEEERASYWKMFQENIYDAGKYATIFDKPSSFAGTIYDMALFSKGLLLRSSSAFSRAIEESGDSTLMQQYFLLQQLRMEHNRNPYSDNLAEADRIERELIQKSPTFRRNMNDLNSDWKSVQKHLNRDDIAIEFINYHTPDSIGHYAAVILRSDYRAPVLVDIAEKESFETQLKDLAINKENSDRVWRPLMPYLNGISNIYFSPSGILHKLAIEYMPLDESEFAFDRYHIFRLSSTKELISETSDSIIKTAIVYGGLEYDADISTLAEAISDNEKTKIAYRSDYTRNVSERIGVNYLQGTLAEAESIERMLTESGVDTKLITEFEGTEESMKRLSGEEIHLFHIATHGFCEVDNNTTGSLISSRISPNQNRDDQIMQKSGILFSGANNTLNDISIPSYMEDGILTAKELSLLDLNNADLVVLSACVTADGDITGDGVFGVQRGLKQAGVKTIMMSSWNVSDIATELLMNRFYFNLTNGKNKHESLLEAIRYVKHYQYDGEEVSDNMSSEEQERIRTLKKGFREYNYWAPFIMLDGID